MSLRQKRTAAQREKALYDRYRENILQLPIPEVGAVSESWRNKCIAMRENVLTKDLRDFLVWDCHLDMEFVPRWNVPWYETLISTKSDRWNRLLKASPNVKSHAFGEVTAYSPVSTQHAYHLQQWEDATGQRFLDDINVIVEVGGGYGNFARMLRRDGFKGLHVIIDLPHSHEAQRLFLSLNDFVVQNIADDVGNAEVVLVREDELNGFMSKLVESTLPHKFAFVSTWGLSECPFTMREKIFPKFHSICSKYLIASQWTYSWEDMDNRKYFEDLAVEARKTNGSEWYFRPVYGFVSESYCSGSVDSVPKTLERHIQPLDLMSISRSDGKLFWRTQGRCLIVPDFLAPDDAEAVRTFVCEQMPDDWWTYAFHAPFQGHRDLPENDAKIVVNKHKSLQEFLAGRIAYRFRRTNGDHYSTCGCAVCRTYTTFASQPLIRHVSSVLGYDVELKTAFMSCYTGGDFLSPHSDDKNGDTAFVWNLSKDWRTAFGGLLHVMKDDWKTIDQVIYPEFNSLVLFNVADGGWPHFVSHVAPGVTAKRVAFSGWFGRKSLEASPTSK